MAEDISPDVIKKTQKLLGKHIKKPALTEKLLKKPPFRFLHDVIISIINDKGFLKGLFSAEELISENIKDKEAKVRFLNKLIDAVKSVTKTDLTVRASKIVAGLEPTKTNLLLQAIGKAIDDKIDASEYIAKLNVGQTDAIAKKKLKKSTTPKDDKAKISKKKIKDDSDGKVSKIKKIGESPKTKPKTDTPKDSVRSKSKVEKEKSSKNDSLKKAESVEEEKSKENSSKMKTSENTTEKQNAGSTTDIVTDNAFTVDIENQNSQDQIKANEHTIDTRQVNENSANALEQNLEKDMKEKEDKHEHFEKNEGKNSADTLIRPKSAARRKHTNENTSSKPGNVNGDHNESSNPMLISANKPQRPKSSLRPPSVRPSSARPGAPRLRPDSALPLQENITMGNINVIIENVDNMDDEETVVIQTTPEISEETFNPVEVPKDNKGQLVEQILEQIQAGDAEDIKKKVDIDWDQDALHNKDGTTREINQLRSLIQTLTKTANPLGKLMNYLHEDIDAMHSELQLWTSIKNQLFNDISKQKRLTEESNKPLLTHLEHLQEEIKKQQEEIIIVRSNVLRNELRIKDLLNI